MRYIDRHTKSIYTCTHTEREREREREGRERERRERERERRKRERERDQGVFRVGSVLGDLPKTLLCTRKITGL